MISEIGAPDNLLSEVSRLYQSVEKERRDEHNRRAVNTEA